MKLILTIIDDHDNESVSHSLIEAGFRVTRIASTGGVLRRGYTTLMIGLQEDRVDQAIEIIDKSTSPPAEPDAKRATLFVLPVVSFTQI
jgi:uncharacterized protein YaaQ